MLKIADYADYMQSMSEITADLFNLVTTVVDRNYVRIAGTHHFSDSIGKPVKNHHVFRYVMEKDKCVMINQPRQDIACLDCSNTEECRKTAAIYTSIKVEEAVVGGLAVIAYDEHQKEKIVNNPTFFQFIEHLSVLISGKLEAEQSSLKLENSLKKNMAILNAVHDGVLAVDHNGMIEQINHSASNFLGIKSDYYIGKSIAELLPSKIVDDIIRQNKPCVDKEIEINIGNQCNTVFLTSEPVNRKTLNGGAVLSFKRAQEINYLAKHLSLSGTQPITFENIIGKSTSIDDVVELAKKVAVGDSTVLIRGESGTGKELFARAIHNESLRSSGPFVAVNCAAIPEPLLESELFGYQEGAFTGARRGGKPGKCELASGGTLFLDEVGDIPLFLQSKFLRMIQERTIERVGDTKTIPIDIRIITATHRNLEAMIENQEFREDLYYRINVIPISLPPLRERLNDIYDISMLFLQKYSERLNKKISDISPEVLDVFSNYDWPGNIRELENAIEYAVNLEPTGTITLVSLPARLNSVLPASVQTNRDSVPKPNKIISLPDSVIQEQRKLIETIDLFGWDTEGKKMLPNI
jgi:sigma-54 dependent transcriptional regulator, acetoin dehydrogenase operon transcriptional activator AcoR